MRVSTEILGCIPQDFWMIHETICKRVLLLLLSWFSHVQLCATPWTAAHQAPPSMGFSRQEHWSGLSFPSPMHESEKWKVKVKSLSRVRLLSTPWTAAYRAPPSMVFSGQQYWSGVPLMLQKAGLWIHATGGIMLPVMLRVVYFTTAVWGKLVFSHGNREDTGSFRKKCWHKYPVFKNSWRFIRPTKQVLKGYYMSGHGYRNACLQAEENTDTSCSGYSLNQLNPLHPSPVSKKRRWGIAGQLVAITQASRVGLLIIFFSILVPSNHWYSTLSSMFHPFLPFVVDGCTLFLSPDFW